jgi:hypothetical protein
MRGLARHQLALSSGCHRLFNQIETCSGVEAFFDNSALSGQLRAGIASGNTRIHSAADWTSDRCHGDDTCLSQHHCRASRELYVFSEQANRLIVVHLENE